MNYRPSDSYVKEFTTSNPSTGAGSDADSLPVATANRNGTDDAAFVLTVAKIDTGRYKITGTVPSGYAANDIVNVTVAATCSGIAGKACVDTFYVVAKRSGDVTQVVASVSGSVASVTAAITLPTMPTDWLTAAGLKADAVAEIQNGLATPTNITAASGIVLAGVTHTGARIPNVTLVDTCTANTDMRGTNSAYTGTPPTVAQIRTELDTNSTQFSAIRAKTDNLPSDPASASSIDTSFATVNTTLDALSNGPSAAEIRQELDTNSTRLAYLTGDAFARLGAPVGASISADIQTRSVYAGEAVAGVTSPVTLTSAYDAAKFAAKPGDKMTLDLTQKLSAPRALDSVADTDLTVNDMMHCAIADATGKATEDVTALTYTVRTPYTGTVLRTFTVDSVTSPTIRS